MSVGAYQTPKDAGTVPVHVQVIDLQPFFERLAVWLHLGRASASRNDEHTFEA